MNSYRLHQHRFALIAINCIFLSYSCHGEKGCDFGRDGQLLDRNWPPVGAIEAIDLKIRSVQYQELNGNNDY